MNGVQPENEGGLDLRLGRKIPAKRTEHHNRQWGGRDISQRVKKNKNRAGKSVRYNSPQNTSSIQIVTLTLVLTRYKITGV